MIITLSHPIHAVDPMAQDPTMNLSTTDHRINRALPTINLCTVGVDGVGSGVVGIHHRLWINDHLTRGVAPSGGAAIEEEVDLVMTMRIQIAQDDIVPVIHMINLPHPSSIVNQNINLLMTIISVRWLNPELRTSLKRTGKILGVKCP
jgi:hypothetical protein